MTDKLGERLFCPNDPPMDLDRLGDKPEYTRGYFLKF
jgi:hypothetical protein